MSKVTFDYSKAAQFISDHEVAYMKKLTLDAKEVLVSKTGAGNDFLGWVDLPVDYDGLKSQPQELRPQVSHTI